MTLGTILTIITMISIAVGLGIRLGSIQQIVAQHARILDNHSSRLDRYEARLVDIVGDVQRIVGRLEATQERIERSSKLASDIAATAARAALARRASDGESDG